MQNASAKYAAKLQRLDGEGLRNEDLCHRQGYVYIV